MSAGNPITGYNINNSLRFRQSSSAYLNRTPASTGNRQIMTFSFWMKRGLLTYAANYMNIFTSYPAASNIDLISFSPSSDSLRVWFNGSASADLVTTQVFRDPSAWYHIVIAIDTTQATAANRIKMYVNGTQITSFSTATYPAQNYNTFWNSSSYAAAIGASLNGPQGYFDGYMAEVNFIDGQALTPSSFGETDTTTGSWKPKAYTGTYGTNGFYFKFSDIATTSGSNAGLGKDSSGNGNYWTTNNISVTAGVTYDAMTDSPTLTSATVANFPVLSPLNYRTYTGSVTPTLSNANLTVTQSSTVASCIGTATMGATASGKYYWEATFVSGSGSHNSFLGVVAGQLQNTTAADLGYYSNEYAYQSGNGNKVSNNTGAAYGSSYTSGDVIGIALDLDAGTLTFYKNNTSQGVAYSGLSASETYFPAFDTYYNNTFAYNFGQRPFAYTPPSGHIAINTYNLPTPTIKAGNKYMDATLYTGTGATATITNAAGFKPDFVWIKCRSGIQDNTLFDSVRGTTKYIISNSTAAETTDATTLTAFNSNGWTMGSFNQINNNASTYVGWQWQASNATGVSNTSGTITSTVSANTTAGFSVVTYTGTGANATVGHGLGVSPKVVLIKERGNANGWYMYHVSLGNTVYMDMQTTAGNVTATGYWQSTTPSSTVVSISSTSSLNRSGGTYVMYAWAEIAGFSKFGSYTGNGSADGTFVYLGFRPAFLMIKRTDSTGGWYIEDLARNTYNVNNLDLQAQSTAAEVNNTAVLDFTSNGFKIRNTYTDYNASGGTYIYMAFASNPFKHANAR